MAGLALGSALAGRAARARRSGRSSCSASPRFSSAFRRSPRRSRSTRRRPSISASIRSTGGSLAVLTAARLVTGFVVLLVPTMLMGLTLPVLSASSLVRGRAFGPRVSALYAVNTAGAVTGAVLTGFYLIGAIGIRRSFLLGAAINVVVGVTALILAWRANEALETSLSPRAARTPMPRPPCRGPPAPSRDRRRRRHLGPGRARARDRLVSHAGAVPRGDDLRVYDDAGDGARRHCHRRSDRRASCCGSRGLDGAAGC